MKKYIISLALLAVIAIPSLVFAQDPELGGTDLVTAGQITSSSAGGGCSIPHNIGELFAYASCILKSAVIPFLIGLGLIIFLIGVVGYISAGDNEEKREAGRNLMLFGIIGLFVMVSVWGFVKLLHNSFFDTPFEVNSGSPVK